MNLYWFKLALARLKLTGIPDTRYTYIIFLKPRAEDLSNKICFIFFWIQIKLLQIFELSNDLNIIKK
jgi:hypothetical protein